jgi:glyoxylase-like metal-dependent hydrolase (beta-lactamase superfamily II)
MSMKIPIELPLRPHLERLRVLHPEPLPEKKNQQWNYLDKPVRINEITVAVGGQWPHVDSATSTLHCNGDILIDVGSVLAVPYLLRNIRKAGFDPLTIKYILATHGDIDHVGGVPTLLKYLHSRGAKTKFLVPQGVSQILHEGNPIQLAADSYGLKNVPNIQPDGEFGEGLLHQVNHPIEAIFLPGHVPFQSGFVIGEVFLPADMNGGLQEQRSELSMARDSWQKAKDLLQGRGIKYVIPSHTDLSKQPYISLSEFFQEFDTWAVTSRDIQPGFGRMGNARN